jgi:hypothetical protein
MSGPSRFQNTRRPHAALSIPLQRRQYWPPGAASTASMHKCPSALHRNSMEVTPRDKPVRSSQLREGIKRYASSDDSDNDESDQVPACRPSLPAAPSAYRTPRRCKRCEACVDTHTVMHAGHMHATTKCRLTRQRAVLLRWTPGSAMMYRTACEECGAVGYIPMAWF